MYLRETKRSNRDGSTVSYLQLAHSERHPVKYLDFTPGIDAAVPD